MNRKTRQANAYHPSRIFTWFSIFLSASLRDSKPLDLRSIHSDSLQTTPQTFRPKAIIALRFPYHDILHPDEGESFFLTHTFPTQGRHSATKKGVNMAKRLIQHYMCCRERGRSIALRIQRSPTILHHRLYCSSPFSEVLLYPNPLRRIYVNYLLFNSLVSMSLILPIRSLPHYSPATD